MNLLYIGPKVEKVVDGGTSAIKMLEVLLSASLESCVHFYHIKQNALPFAKKLISFFTFSPYQNIHQICLDIKKTAEEKETDVFFIASSRYGKIAEYLKKTFPQKSIIIFFHNIEKKYAYDYCRVYKPKTWYFYICSCICEKKAVLYSDYVINLNERDAKELLKTYGRKSDFVLPFSVKNEIKTEHYASFLLNKHRAYGKNALFVGSAFFGNIDGVKWFAEKILPHTGIHLTIVGNKMDSFFTSSSNISVYGYVEDLAPFYESADFVVLPIISGSGMKTKTAESLMYGKVIVGTPEAFCGYDIENTDGLFAFSNLDEFNLAVEKIEKGKFYKFNKDIHELFLNKYSYEIALTCLREFFKIVMEADNA